MNYYQHDAADLIDFTAKGIEVSNQAEHAALAVLLAQHLDDMDTITVCASGAQPRNNCVLDVVLGRAPNGIALRHASLAARERRVGGRTSDGAARNPIGRLGCHVTDIDKAPQ